MRERIEVELASDGHARPPRRAKEPVDPETVRDEVDDFVALARSGAYLGGNRQVSPRERSRWRFTFRRLAAEAQDALGAEDAGPAASAVEQLIDLACEAGAYDYFRSEDPVAAAGFVVSDVAAVLWASTWERCGFHKFAETAAPQLIRWESRHGWTRYGEGSVAAKETTLKARTATREPHLAPRCERDTQPRSTPYSHSRRSNPPRAARFLRARLNEVIDGGPVLGMIAARTSKMLAASSTTAGASFAAMSSQRPLGTEKA